MASTENNAAENCAEAVITELKSIGCCNCCVLRYLNISNASELQRSSETINKLLGKSDEDLISPEPKVKRSNPCTGCLGLFQTYQNEFQLEKIAAEVKNAGFDSDDVTFALSLPISLQLRNNAIWLHVLGKFNAFYLNRPLVYDVYAVPGDLKQDTSVTSVKEAWKLLFSPVLSERLGKSAKDGTSSQFVANIFYKYADDEKETACIANMHPDIFKNRSKQTRKYHNEVLTRKSVEQVLDKTDRQLFEAHSSIPAQVPLNFIVCDKVVCSHESLYIAGRYNKYSRSLSQTPWMINGERRMESSVEELIRVPIAAKIPHDVIKFSSSGREDVDVRMLGRGRPFVLDVQNPRVTKLSFSELRCMEQQINSSTTSIFVRDLQIIPKQDLSHIKSGEQTKTKTYHCFCVAAIGERSASSMKEKIESLNSLESFVIQQRTPMRVLHRRPLAVRPRTVHWIKASPASVDGNQMFFKLSVKVEAGTYIKELVHGDLGRTIPNLSSMLNFDADILALDVEEIDLAWPPAIKMET